MWMQVFNRLHKLILCMSSSATTLLIDKLGVDHDQEVLKWRNLLLPLVPVSVCNFISIKYLPMSRIIDIIDLTRLQLLYYCRPSSR